MGSAPSIQEMQKKEDDFDGWVAKRTLAVKEECGAARDELVTKFNEDMPAFDDFIVLRDKYWSDFSHDEVFSLAAISDIIQKVSGALFGAPGGGGGSASTAAEGGVDVEAPKLAATDIANLAQFANVEALIAAKALNLIAGILNVFDTKASLMSTFQSGIEEISPGMYVGISARRTEYSGHDIFHDTTVLETYFVVLVKYSHKAFMANQQIFDDAAISATLAGMRSNFLSKFQAKLAETDPFDDQAMTVLTNAVTRFEASIAAIEGLGSKSGF
jgi:hypothetical protein